MLAQGAGAPEERPEPWVAEARMTELSEQGRVSFLPVGFETFHANFLEAAAKGGTSREAAQKLYEQFVELVRQSHEHPHSFAPFHEAERSPFDYYAFGLEFIRPLIDFSHSTLQDEKALSSINAALEKGHNVILTANHQTEIDPQIISLLLEKKYPKLASEMIFIAGHRVVEDPLAAALSRGRNLLCIYSKKYIDHPPEQKREKIAHNIATFKIMEELLQQGGKCIYVAPSGGRDREDESGKVCPAPFQADSIGMLVLIANKVQRPTHFHPLSLYTYPLLPPPPSISYTLGEVRKTTYSPAHLFFGPEIDVTIGNSAKTPQEQRKILTDHIMRQVVEQYRQCPL